MRIHLIAVSGTGMGPLAGLLKQLGHDVSGSDVAFDPPIGPALRAWGVRLVQGFDPANLVPPPELVVIGNVCRKDNPEAVAAIEQGLPYTHIAGALQRFVLSETSPLVVSGTHGKTTTSALSAWLLECSGYSPGFLIGGLPKNFPRSFQPPLRGQRRLPSPERPHRRPVFVIEGDEYDTAFFEKTAKFLHYGPEVAIVTSIEHDHIDIYPSYQSYLQAFRDFIELVPEHGLVVAHAADRTVVELVGQHSRAPVAWYALQGDDTNGVVPHWLAAPSQGTSTALTFDLFAGGVACGRYALGLPGLCNLRNALAAVAAAAQGYGAPLKELGSALASFAGVRRRQELIGAPRGIFVYEDFAHHPTAVRETLLALRSRHPNGQLFAVFEPRTATACRKLHQEEYAHAFDAADRVLLPPLARAGLAPEERLDLERLVLDLEQRGKSASLHPDIDSIVETLRRTAVPGDLIALLSNGFFGGIHAKLLAELES